MISNNTTLTIPESSAPTRLSNEGTSMEIFDALRRKWVALTPEERVRQAFVEFLINRFDYPSGRIGNEITISLNDRPVRCDSIIYDGFAKPVAVVEYKAPEVAITQKTFDQILRYSIALGNRWIIISNGVKHYCAEIIPGNPPCCRFLTRIPYYSEL